MEALRKLKDGRILWGGVGSGKSRVALAYYLVTGGKEDIYVITTAKKRDTLDWEGEAAKFGIGKEVDGTVAGRLVVDSWNNLHKYTEVEDAFFVFDERKWRARDVGKSFSKGRRGTGGSCSPPREIPGSTYLGVRGQRGLREPDGVQARTSSTTRIPSSPRSRYVGVQRLVRLRSQLLVRMPYEKETVRHDVNVWVDYDAEMMKRVRETAGTSSRIGPYVMSASSFT
jgi:hypothetical protein